MTDSGGGPVTNAVVYVTPVDDKGNPKPVAELTLIDQIGKEYVPYVTAVQSGTPVNFPNHDPVRHHVYSFSSAKSFEIPLYSGTPAEPVLFDHPGAVTLGCNIHDWMTAYVYVTDTPYFALTAPDGHAVVRDLPAGDYAVRVWHPTLRGPPEATDQRVSLGSDDAPALDFSIEQKRVWRARRSPSLGGSTYR